jgi:hypothetical protein
MYQSSNLTNMSLSPLLFEQVDVQLSGQMGETGTNGVVMNAIPKAGGNEFRGTVLVSGSAPSLQGDNVTENLQSRGLQGASTRLKKLYDINGALGGPVVQDKLWFFVTSRYFTNNFYVASRFYPEDVSAFRRVDDTARQAYGGTYTYDNNGRLTWAINDKQKFTGWYAYQYKVDPFWLIQTLIQAPEASRITTWNTQLSTFKYTYIPTSRFLVEAGVAAGASPDTIKADLSRVGGIAIQELGGAVAPALTFRAPTSFDFDDRLPSQSFNVAGSYVTGSHNAKVGMELQRGHFWRGDNNDSTGGVWYQTRDYVPLTVIIQAPVTGYQNNLNYNLGLFAQDRWTLNRLTLNGGVRLDLQNESTEPFTAGPHRWAPNRNVSFPAVKNVPNWKDINPRFSAAYDLFGNGKTAVKGSVSRGVRQDSIAIALANNPATTIQTQTARNWTDGNNNRVPDCDLLNPAAQGAPNAATALANGVDFCGAWLTPAFGTAVPGTTYDPAILNGWGVRPYNWEFSATVQQEVAPRVSVGFGYFRRTNGNFQITDNEALTAADFTRFDVVIPANGSSQFQLPNVGETVAGYYDVNRVVAARNVVKDAATFGEQIDRWDGVDLNADVRLTNGLRLQGGISTGRTTTDNCDIVDDAPELLAGSPVAYCHQESPYLPQYKALASYTLPYGVRVAGTFQSIPGPNVLATASVGLLQTTLGRAFTSAATTLALMAPQTEYGDRLNQFDLRFTKVLPVGRGSVDLNFDVYNAFNSDAVLTQSNTFGGAWQRPSTVIQPRFLKLSVRWDF